MARRDADTPQRSTTQLVRITWRVIREVFKVTPAITLYSVFGVVIFGLFPFAYSYIQSEVIDELTVLIGTGVAALAGDLAMLILLYVVLSIFGKLNNALFNYLDRVQYQRLTEHFTLNFIEKASELDLYHYEDSGKNDLIQRAQNSYSYRPQNMYMDTLWAFSSLVSVIASIGVVASFSVPLFVVLLFTTLPTLVINIQKADLSYGIWDANTETRRRYYASSDHLQNEQSLMELRIFGTKSYLFDIVRNTFKDFFSKEQKAAQSHTLWDSISGVITEIGLVVVFVAAIIAVLNGEITIGLFTFYSSAAGRFSGNLASLFRKLTRVREGANYMHDYYEFMGLENTIVPGSRKMQKPEPEKPPRIEFKHVDFAYPGTDKPVLDNFELTIEPGERIAFVGENGAGKTTIVKLLSRFYDVTSGQILIDGVDLREYDISEWYSQIGVLFQSFVKYDFLPVKQSIGVGDLRNIDNMEEIVKSAKKSGADEFIADFKNKYDQILSKKFPEGVDLSGGQWQRVALSRAFFRDAPILILDEPTSAIDPKGEAEIFEKLYEFSEGKTVIIISHRFSTVRQADKIYVVEHGKIIESGSHEQLMDIGGKYKEAFETQAKGYK